MSLNSKDAQTVREWEARVLKFPVVEDEYHKPDDKVIRDAFGFSLKNQECHCCKRTILKNERHRVHIGKYDGSVKTWRYCIECCEKMAEENSTGSLAALLKRFQKFLRRG